jgi:hypothetical protein
MSSPRQQFGRRTAAAVVGAGIVAGSLSLTASPAAAIQPNCTGVVELKKSNGEQWSRPAINGSTDCFLRPVVAGAPVLVLQQALIQCYGQSIGEWGYGSETVKAVKNVQAFHGIKQDGVYGPLTGSYMAWYGRKPLPKGGYVTTCLW